MLRVVEPPVAIAPATGAVEHGVSLEVDAAWTSDRRIGLNRVARIEVEGDDGDRTIRGKDPSAFADEAAVRIALEVLERAMERHLGREAFREWHRRRVTSDPAPGNPPRIREVLGVGAAPEESLVDLRHRGLLGGHVDVDVVGAELQKLRGDEMLERLLGKVVWVVDGISLPVPRRLNVRSILARLEDEVADRETVSSPHVQHRGVGGREEAHAAP